jgi:hypothetical protein
LNERERKKRLFFTLFFSPSPPLARQTILDWFEKKDLRLLAFVLDAKGGLEPTYSFPSKMSAKGVYFMKPMPDMVITKDNINVRISSSSPRPSRAALPSLPPLFFS